MLNLKIGQKITVLKSDSLVPELYKGILKGYYYSKFAQHENALYLYIQRPRAKKVDRIIISSDTAFIFNGYALNDIHRKEVISDNGDIKINKLHRWTYEDFKDNKDLIFYHEFRSDFDGVNNNIERFIDLTGEYIQNNNIRSREAIDNEGYISYIKELVQNYNINNLKQFIRNEGYSILEKCLNLATEYNW